MPPVPAPSHLGRYPVRRRLGAGAFATVWLAYDEQLDSPVAIKVLAENWTEDHHVRQRFLEEGRFLRKVESPHVVGVYDAGELDDGRPFLVMTYADQGTLADRLELAPLTHAQALHVIGEVGEGLSALHDRDVLHRDLKPANVLFRTVTHARHPRVVAMLADLGLGKALDMSSRLTMIGGTPSYVAPEQARGEGLDARADQYSLAALTYHLLAGRVPYEHTTLAAAGDPGPPPPMGVALPPGVEQVVRRGLSRDREDRFADVGGYVAALTEAMGESTGQAPEAWIPLDPELTQAAPRPRRSDELAATRLPDDSGAAPARRRRIPVALAAPLALVLGAGVGFGTERLATTTRTLEDSTGTISVTVPERWTRSVQPEQWTPPESDVEYAALSAGSAAGWNSDGDPAPGVFVALLPGDRLPSEVPGHPECSQARPVVHDEQDGDASMTAHHSGCEGADVTVERVVQATSDLLLWVQVRSDSTSTANRVLDSVALHGM